MYRLNVDRFLGSIAVVLISDLLYLYTSPKREHEYGSFECSRLFFLKEKEMLVLCPKCQLHTFCRVSCTTYAHAPPLLCGSTTDVNSL